MVTVHRIAGERWFGRLRGRAVIGIRRFQKPHVYLVLYDVGSELEKPILVQMHPISETETQLWSIVKVKQVDIGRLSELPKRLADILISAVELLHAETVMPVKLPVYWKKQH
jgi:hypothetical protein